MIGGVEYDSVDDDGLWTKKGEKKELLKVDQIIVCAGQMSLFDLEEPLKEGKCDVFRIGGALEAGDLDAKRAIDQGCRLAADIENVKPGDDLSAPETFSSKVYKFVSKYQ